MIVPHRVSLCTTNAFYSTTPLYVDASLLVHDDGKGGARRAHPEKWLRSHYLQRRSNRGTAYEPQIRMGFLQVGTCRAHENGFDAYLFWKTIQPVLPFRQVLSHGKYEAKDTAP